MWFQRSYSQQYTGNIRVLGRDGAVESEYTTKNKAEGSRVCLNKHGHLEQALANFLYKGPMVTS